MDAGRRKLIDENSRLRGENQQLRLRTSVLESSLESATKQVELLSKKVDKLTAALEEARRAGKRQAAPFRKKKKKATAKKPGRKPGDDYGTHARREAPRDEEITERIEIPLPSCCENCESTKITPGDPVVQYQIELPKDPIYRKFTTQTGTCVDCGQTVRGRHPLQTSEATGAAGTQLGPRAHACMAWLNKRLGLSHGKIRQLFEELFGITISRSTSARSCQRTAERCRDAFEQVKQDVRGSPQVTPDETGWRVGGGKAWLHAFAAHDATCYLIDPTRSGTPAKELLGLDWSGWLVHDGWSPYNHFTQATHQQCNAHLINRCNELLQTALAGAARFPGAVKALLQKGLAARNRHDDGEISTHGSLIVAGQLTNELLRLVGRRKTNDDNERLARFLFQHHEEVFAYLRHPGMDATNYRGEQAIRPAVVNRKVWGGNRTWTGTDTQSTIMSVIQTCTQRALSPITFLIRALTSSSNDAVIPRDTR